MYSVPVTIRNKPKIFIFLFSCIHDAEGAKNLPVELKINGDFMLILLYSIADSNDGKK